MSLRERGLRTLSCTGLKSEIAGERGDASRGCGVEAAKTPAPPVVASPARIAVLSFGSVPASANEPQ